MRKVLLALIVCCLLPVAAQAVEPAPAADAEAVPTTRLFADAEWTEPTEPTELSPVEGAKAEVAGFPGCAKIVSQERCQTGGTWTNSCSQCSGTCYHRYEGWVVYYMNGKKSSGWQQVTRCSPPPSMATCNSTCQ